MALDRSCVAHEQPTESTHCFDLGTRREEDHRTAKGNMEKNSRRRKAEDGFHHLERSCYCCKRQSGLEETSQRPYSPRGDIGNKEGVDRVSIKGRSRVSTKGTDQHLKADAFSTHDPRNLSF